MLDIYNKLFKQLEFDRFYAKWSSPQISIHICEILITWLLPPVESYLALCPQFSHLPFYFVSKQWTKWISQLRSFISAYLKCFIDYKYSICSLDIIFHPHKLYILVLLCTDPLWINLSLKLPAAPYLLSVVNRSRPQDLAISLFSTFSISILLGNQKQFKCVYIGGHRGG